MTPPAATCEQWLAALDPQLPTALITPEARHRLQVLASHLPGRVTTVLEARLGARSTPYGAVDLSIRLKDPADGRTVAARIAGCPEHLQSLFDRQSWPAPMSALWLEFDLHVEPPTGKLPVPSLCARLSAPPEPGLLYETLVPALLGEALSADDQKLCDRVLSALPPSGELLYVFAMLPRDPPSIRFELYGLRPQEMVQLAEHLTGEVPHLRAVAPLFDDVERLHFSFDIHQGRVLPRFGIEGGFKPQPAREPGWRRLFDRLIDVELASAEQRDAALGWVGQDTPATLADRWPRQEMIPGRVLVRALSHLKVVVRPDASPEAKVYLLIGHAQKVDGRMVEY